MLLSRAETFWSAISTLKDNEVGSPKWLQAFASITQIAGATGTTAVNIQARDYLFEKFGVSVGPASANDDNGDEDLTDWHTLPVPADCGGQGDA